jgi:hypothetical protein
VFALIEPEFDEAFGMRVIGLNSRSCVVALEQALAEHLRAYAAERGNGGR